MSLTNGRTKTFGTPPNRFGDLELGLKQALLTLRKRLCSFMVVIPNRSVQTRSERVPGQNERNQAGIRKSGRNSAGILILDVRRCLHLAQARVPQATVRLYHG